MKHLGLIYLGVIAAWSMPVQADEVNTGYFGNVAIEGYDTVAYFIEKRAVKGSEKFQSDWLGATWQFSSDENRKKFDASPMDYAPQYGGLCAEGVGYNEMTVNIEPEVWQIIDGKLYISAGAGFEDLATNRLKSDANWPVIHAELQK